MTAHTTDAVDLRDWMKRRLLPWFRAHQRALPWREDRDPYRILISEVMLQQTQVATVIGYFERFIEAFPSLRHLAEADEQDVLRLWQGLGYYRRARNLHRAAQLLQSNHAGELPNDPDVLRALPGMGRYTVNAVLSQAHDRRLPILEANSRRVLCRLFGRKGDPSRAPLHEWLWQAAEQLLPLRKHAGEMNQAIMELGSLICTPATPKCHDCPLKSKCAARALQLQDSIPRRAAPPHKIKVNEVALVIARNREILLVQRPRAASRWASLWEAPHVELKPDESHGQAAARLLTELGLSATIGREITTIRHGVTHFAITMVCLSAEHQRGMLRSDFYTDHRWLGPEDLATPPVSSPQRRLIRIVADQWQSGTLLPPGSS